MKIGTLALATFMAFTSGTAALAQSEFYRGKQLKIIVGSEAGGGFSSYSLLLSAYLGKNIPGNPAVSIQHLPGSGGVNAIDYLANAAPKDGTVMPSPCRTSSSPPSSTERREFNPAPFPLPSRMSDGAADELAHRRKTIDDLKAPKRSWGHRRAARPRVDPQYAQRNPWHQDEGHHRLSTQVPQPWHRSGASSGHTIAYSTLVSLHRLAARQEGQHHRRARLH